jgi:hypothetical protein
MKESEFVPVGYDQGMCCPRFNKLICAASFERWAGLFGQDFAIYEWKPAPG